MARILSKIPFTNRPESSLPYCFAISMASLRITFSGTSLRKMNS